MNLLAELGRLLRLMDPMPPRVIADAEAARLLLPGRRTGWDPDGACPLVALLETIPAVRSAGRRLSLGRHGGEAVLAVEIRHAGPGLRLAGLAPRGSHLVVHRAAGAEEVPVDDAGYFTVDIPAGPVRLLLTGPDGRTGATGWL